MNRLILALASGLLVAAGAGAASAQAPSSGMTQGGGDAAAVITALERRLIRDYFKGLGREVLGGARRRGARRRRGPGQGKGQG